MKYLKKVMALVLAVVMVMAMSVMAFADDVDTSTNTYSITVKEGYKGETYTAYKIFGVEYSGENYAYTISQDNEWFKSIVGSVSPNANGDYVLNDYGIKLQKTKTNELYNVVNAGESGPTVDQMSKLAEVLAQNITGKTPHGTGKVEWDEDTDSYGEKANVTINVIPNEAGYYLVTTTTGSLCALDTSNPNAEVTEKNAQPTIDKKESLQEGNVGSVMSYTDSSVDMSIGDTVYFEIQVTDGKGTNDKIIVHDTQSQGLTINNSSIKVYQNGSEIDSSNYTINSSPTDGHTFDITFNSDYVKKLEFDDKVIIRYNATLNSNAVIYSNENNNHDNNNIAFLEYSGQHTAEIKVIQHTFKFQLVKDNKDKEILSGAKFKMYPSVDSTVAIGFIKKGDTYRSLSVGEDNTTQDYTEEIEAGTPIFLGFGPGTYWFEEIEAPASYNKLTERKSIEITSDGKDNIAIFETSGENTGNYKEGGLEVTNLSGLLLPSTGGTGTTMFYIIGGILVVAAVVLLVAKRRMRGEE